MAPISRIETNASALRVKHTIRKRSELWNKPGSCVHRRSIIYETSDGVEVTSEQNKLNTCVYDTLNETFVHLTKADFPSFVDRATTGTDNHVRVVDGQVELKIAAAPNCLKANYYDKLMMDPERPVVLFNRTTSNDEFHCAGRVKYVSGSFVPIDESCRRKKFDKATKTHYYIAQPTLRVRMLDVTPDQLAKDPNILCLPLAVPVCA